MNIQCKAPTIDVAYRQAVRDAVGRDYLREMTERCLRKAAALTSADLAPAPGGPDRVRQLHSLAGGAAAVGLPALAACLHSLEEAYRGGSEAEWLTELWAFCREQVQACSEALADDAS